MNIFAIDPSIERTGAACINESNGRISLVDCAMIKINPRKGRTVDRAVAMANEIDEYIRSVGVDVSTILLEVPGGHQHGRIMGRAAHIATYGLAVGVIYKTLLSNYGEVLHPIYVNDWTGGKRKITRQRRVIATFSNYNPATDKGLDVSDACAMALWWIAERRLGAAGERK